ncbi:MAG: hypothetical protein U9Q03_01935 [Patescibacteria group bacterium]|nr:hypothetical protein [Patescibacteria group bacterium]
MNEEERVLKRKVLSLNGWNVFGHFRETAEHGELTGGRVAFHGTRTAFDDEGCPVTLRGIGPVLKWMGCDDDENGDSAGCSAEFYGTRNGRRVALPALSQRGRAQALDTENAMLSGIGLDSVGVLRRFLLSSKAGLLSRDDQQYCWDVLRECEACKSTDEADERIESLFRDIKRNLAGRKNSDANRDANRFREELRTLTDHPKFNRLHPEVQDWTWAIMRRFGYDGWANDARSQLKKVRDILSRLEHQARKPRRKARPASKSGARKSKGNKAPAKVNGRKINDKPVNGQKAKGGRRPRFHTIELVEGKNPKTGQVEYQARTGRGVLFVLRRNSTFVPTKGEQVRIREDGVIARTRRGLIIAVVPA